MIFNFEEITDHRGETLDEREGKYDTEHRRTAALDGWSPLTET